MSVPLVPPHDLDAEGAVLAAVLLDRRAIDAAGDLSPEDFYSESHRRIFEAVAGLHADHQPVDAVTVAQRLKAAGRLEQVGGMAYLAEVLNSSPMPGNVAAHARIVRDKARLRAVISAAHRIASEGYSATDATAFADAAAKTMADLSLGKSDGAFESYLAVVRRVMATSTSRMLGKTDLGVPSGFPALDGMILNLRPGKLFIVAARPGYGKSTLGLNIAFNVASREGCDAALFSLEMGNEENALRCLAADAKVDGADIFRGIIAEHMHRLTDSANRAGNVRLWLNDDSGMTIPKLRRLIRGLQGEVERKGRKLRLVVVDYLQLFGAEAGKRNATREQDVSAVSRGLKGISREFGVAVIAISQLNRDVDKGSTPRRPVMSDLRESGSLEQDADGVIFIHPIGELSPDGYQDCEVIVSKMRDGKQGAVKMKFRKPFTRFDEVDEHA